MDLAQLGTHIEPCGLLDFAGFYGKLTEFLDGATAQGFMKVEHRDMLIAADTADELLARFYVYMPPRVSK